jgi:hypothetical protein
MNHIFLAKSKEIVIAAACKRRSNEEVYSYQNRGVSMKFSRPCKQISFTIRSKIHLTKIYFTAALGPFYQALYDEQADSLKKSALFEEYRNAMTHR